MRKRTLLFCFFIALLAHSKSLKPGKSGGHEADIYAVLPFERSERISQMIYVLHQNIDFPIGYFEGLRTPPHQDFTWHRYGHRVFFHWGFNSDPKKSKILQELVAERGWSAEVERQFWSKVVAEQARRNKESMAVVGQNLGFSLTGKERDYANAFASIINDIHILGDYSTTNIQTLQEINLVVADLRKALFESLQGGDEAKRINKLLNQTSTYTDKRERAQALLVILQRELPKFFPRINNGYFARHFKAQGIALKR